jgi:lysophospholipase L1-like esterase
MGVMFCVAWIAGCAEVQVPDPDVRVVAFGDSTTAGPAGQDYGDTLRIKLGEPIESFANEGKSGETSGEGVARLQQLLQDKIYPNAETLLYWEGAGDIIDFMREYDPFLIFAPDDPNFPFSEPLKEMLDRVQTNIEHSIALAKQANLSVFVATYYFLRANIGQCDAMPLKTLLPDQAEHANRYVVLLNERIRQAVENQNAVLVDLEILADSISEDPGNYFDCNHLSAQGNDIVAQAFFDAVKSKSPATLSSGGNPQ